MFKTTIAILAIGIIALGFVACDSSTNEGGGSGEGGDSGKGSMEKGTSVAGCICDQGKAGETIWCQDCSVGYVAKEKTACEGCFAAKIGGPVCEAGANK
jgi:hypothetical protein